MLSPTNVSYVYEESAPYASSVPYQYITPKSSISKTLMTIAGVIGLGILAGMGLGLGLGIGAAGIVSDTSLVNVTNTTSG